MKHLLTFFFTLTLIFMCTESYSQTIKTNFTTDKDEGNADHQCHKFPMFSNAYTLCMANWGKYAYTDENTEVDIKQKQTEKRGIEAPTITSNLRKNIRDFIKSTFNF